MRKKVNMGNKLKLISIKEVAWITRVTEVTMVTWLTKVTIVTEITR